MISINPFDPVTLVLIAVLNPATIIIAFMMGRRADQWQKLPVAAFAAALGGFLLYYAAAFVGIFQVHAVGGEAGIVMMQFVLGFIWALVSYYYFHIRSA
jgi:hypothetical protein